MTDKIENYISKKITTFASRLEMEHCQSEFLKFANLPKNKLIYETRGGWKLLLMPAVEEKSAPYFLMKLDSTTEDTFWESTLRISESKNTAAVSESFATMIKDMHQRGGALEHLFKFEDVTKVMLKRRITTHHLAPYLKDGVNLDTVNAVNHVHVLEGLSTEFVDALGGKFLLGVPWQQYNSDKDIAKAMAIDKALFLEAYCQSRGIELKVPLKNEFNTIKIGASDDVDMDSKKVTKSLKKDKHPHASQHQGNAHQNSYRSVTQRDVVTPHVPKTLTNPPVGATSKRSFEESKSRYSGPPCEKCTKSGDSYLVGIAQSHSTDNCRGDLRRKKAVKVSQVKPR